MEQISPHFTLAELVTSEVALRHGLDNTPSQEEVANLRRLCAELLEPVHELLGVPLHVNSAFRSMAVNIRVGGSSKSAHMDGRAADIVPIGMNLRTAFDKIRASGLPFDQLILECGSWIHLAVAREGEAPRFDQLLAQGGPGRWTYQKATS